MKRLSVIPLLVLGAFALSACGTPTTATWPGLAADASSAYLANGPYVYAVRLSDGAKLWQYPQKAASSLFYSAPVVTSDGQVLVGSAGSDNALFSLDAATGQPKWAAPFTASSHWIASPLVVENAVYAANNNGTLYVLDLATGQMQWSLPLGLSLWGAPVTNGKLVFVSALDHHLYAVDPTSRSLAWSLDLGGAAPSSASVSTDGATVFIGSFSRKVLGIDAASGTIRWTADARDWVWAAPSPDGDTVYAADIGGNVYSLGAPNGKNAWPEIKPDGPITGGPLALGDGVVVATESGTVYAYDPTGAAKWSAVVGGKIYTTPVLAGDRILVAPYQTDFLVAALSLDGQVLWKFSGK